MEGKALFVIIFMSLFVVFALQNSGETAITFLKWQSPPIPLVFLLLFSLAMGMLLANLFGMVKKIRLKNEIKELKKLIEAQDDELKHLRTLSLFHNSEEDELTEPPPAESRESTDNDSF